jgi:ferredoxin-NADP reductase
MNQPIYTCELQQRSQLSAGTFELALSCPRHFTFEPGQRIRLLDRPLERDYSLANAPDDSSLRLCIRRVPTGIFSSKLHAAAEGSRFEFTGPHGHFVFRPSGRPAVFVATGTGAAPFASMARSGARGFTLLHGIRYSNELLYADLFQTTAGAYVPCISEKNPPADRMFHGRVTAYVEQVLPPGAYDFYLCGRSEMVRDVTWLIDERFPDSRVYTEIFF